MEEAVFLEKNGLSGFAFLYTLRELLSRTVHFLQCLGYMPETESSWKRFSEPIN